MPSLSRSLFVEKSAHDQRQNLALAQRQAAKALVQLGEVGPLPHRLAIPRNGGVNRTQQIFLLNGLIRKSIAPALIARTAAGMSP